MSSDMVRITGLNSGLDTESIIGAYTSKVKKNVQDAKNGLTLNKWTQDAWADMNTKIYGFYANTLSNGRMSSSYVKTKVTTSNSALSVVAGAKAAKGVQNAKILETASAAFLTGSKIDVAKGSDNLLDTLGIASNKQITFESNGETKTIEFGGTSSEDGSVIGVNTMDELVKAFEACGINSSYDANNGRIFLSAKDTGSKGNFKLGGDIDTLKKLGLATAEQGASEEEAASVVKGSNAKLMLNNAIFESETNTFTINDSTYTINHMPSDPNENIAVTTADDYDGIYDVVKNLVKEYNDLINEVYKQYNADDARDYDPLSDEQKEQMSEKEVEEWEKKIKGSLLRNDENLYDVMSELINDVSMGVEIDGKTMYLSDFGISTLGYFEVDEKERYALHIDGDSADAATGTKTDKLKSMIASDPETVSKFFAGFCNKMYEGLYKKMGSTSVSSIYKVYNDKQLKTEQTDWEKKVSDLESKLDDMEEKYYKKFASMETTLAKVNSKQSSLGQLFS